ncbi:MAG: phosphoenolpyruvate--protein phosphotransferase [Oscillospiraceae bacterium]|jgi:phosphotransferase system enzyme I (PtsI)|nr:phosphoenolpyruvate--protein phosphotransferase [Oscillospiraceae bacterium]
MTTIKGKAISGGIAVGKLRYYNHDRREPVQYTVDDPELEVERFYQARVEAIGRIQELYMKALQRAGEQPSLIFQVHQVMLEDMDFEEAIIDIIRNERKNAEYAVYRAAQKMSLMIATLDDPYLQERSTDVIDSAYTLLDALAGRNIREMEGEGPVILAARDLMPSETLHVDQERLLGFITNHGSVNSHSAILARNMGVPAVAQLPEELEQHNGETVILNGITGQVVFCPDPETLAQAVAQQRAYRGQEEDLKSLLGLENITRDGQRIHLCANIGSVGDLSLALCNEAEGIGLFRSEFLFLGKDRPPSEEEQFVTYRAAAERMGGRRVIIRTLDVGGDKRADYFRLPEEENPSMGYRAIRVSLGQPNLFRIQLRAFYRAAVYGNLALMLPLITSVEEIRAVKELIKQVQAELLAERKPFAECVELGIMIETPAAVMISDRLAREVDFFSIGTNDLIQFTLAADRQNPKVENVFRPHHPAVLRMIQIAANAIHKEGKWIAICGEMAADTTLTETFLALGIDELSMSANSILRVRQKVRSLDMSNRDKILECLR